MAQFYGHRPYKPQKRAGFWETLGTSAAESLGRLPLQMAGQTGSALLTDWLSPSARQERDIGAAQEARAGKIHEMLMGSLEPPAPEPAAFRPAEIESGLGRHPAMKRVPTGGTSAGEALGLLGAGRGYEEVGEPRMPRVLEAPPLPPPTRPTGAFGLTPAAATTGARPTFTFGRPEAEPPVRPERDYLAELAAQREAKLAAIAAEGEERRRTKGTLPGVAPRPVGRGRPAGGEAPYTEADWRAFADRTTDDDLIEIARQGYMTGKTKAQVNADIEEAKRRRAPPIGPREEGMGAPGEPPRLPGYATTSDARQATIEARTAAGERAEKVAELRRVGQQETEEGREIKQSMMLVDRLYDQRERLKFRDPPEAARLGAQGDAILDQLIRRMNVR